MKNIGWTIAVDDFYARDKATKLIKGDREKAEKKCSVLQEQYDAIEKERFKVSILAPLTEIDPSKRALIEIKRPEEVTNDLLLKALTDVDPFIITENTIEIEPDKLETLQKSIDFFNKISQLPPVQFKLL